MTLLQRINRNFLRKTSPRLQINVVAGSAETASLLLLLLLDHHLLLLLLLHHLLLSYFSTPFRQHQSLEEEATRDKAMTECSWSTTARSRSFSEGEYPTFWGQPIIYKGERRSGTKEQSRRLAVMGKSRGARRGVEEDRSTEQPLLIQGKEYTPDRYTDILISWCLFLPKYIENKTAFLYMTHMQRHTVRLCYHPNMMMTKWTKDRKWLCPAHISATQMRSSRLRLPMVVELGSRPRWLFSTAALWPSSSYITFTNHF